MSNRHYSRKCATLLREGTLSGVFPRQSVLARAIALALMVGSSVALAELPPACETEYDNANGDTVPIGGLIGCWPLNTDLRAGTAPDGITKYGPDGALNAKGTATFGIFEDQEAMFFNGKTFVEIPLDKFKKPNGKPFAPNNEPFTFAIWVTIPDGKNHQFMKLSDSDGYPTAGLVKRASSDHRGKFVSILNNWTQASYVFSDNPGGAFSKDTWIHVTGVFQPPTTSDGNDGSVTLYINGELENEFTKRKGYNFDPSSNPGAANVKLRIGANNSSTNPARHVGWLYDARIYDRALTKDEIKLIAGNQKQVNHSDPCQALEDPDRAPNVVVSNRAVGLWNDPATWSPRVPGPDDWVIIRSGHVVTAPQDSAKTCEDADFSIDVTGLCVQRGAKLRSAAKGFSASIAADFLNNRGTIRGRDRNWPGGDDVCISINTDGWLKNTGTIQSGNVLNAYTSVDGGQVHISTDMMLNMGNIFSGSGPHGVCSDNVVTPAGKGGEIMILPTDYSSDDFLDLTPAERKELIKQLKTDSIGKLVNRGTILSGVGGTFFNIHCTPQVDKSAAGGRIVFQGAGQKGIVGHHGAWIWIDPIQMIFSNETQIMGSDVFIVTDDNGSIQANDLQPSAVSAEKILTLAVGTGGTIDLSKVADKAFKAGEEMRIFTDNLILPEGKTLQDLVDAPKITQAGGKTIYYAVWNGEDAKVDGDPNTSVSLPLTLLNVGPTTDSYTLSIQDTLGWSLCSLPATVNLDSQAKTTLDCPLTLPATAETNNIITVTATSQNDPSMQAISEIVVHVGPVSELVADDLELPPPTFTVSSMILDGDQQPVMDVTVQIGDQSATSDDGGYWEIPELPEGKYPVTVTKGGYTFEYAKEIEVGNGDMTLNIAAHSLLAMKVECPRVVDQGAEVSCQYTVSNQGVDKTTGVSLTLEPSPNLLLTSLTGDNVSCSIFAAPYTCTLPDLEPGVTAKVTMVANNDGFEALENQFIETKATLSSTNYPTETIMTETNVRPHLWIVTKCLPNPVPMQGQLECLVTAQLNEKATEPAEGVEISLPKTSGVTVLNVQPSTGQCDSSDPRDILCTLDKLKPGEKSTVTLNLKLEDVGFLIVKQQATVSAENYPTDAGGAYIPVSVVGEADLVILMDTTSSMQDELDSITAAFEDFIAGLPVDKKLTIALVEFKDDVKVRAFTQDPQIVVKALESLKVEGGGLCPEASAEALEFILQHLKPQGTVIFASDAPPYPGTDVQALKAKIAEKQATFIPILTISDCAANELAQ